MVRRDLNRRSFLAGAGALGAAAALSTMPRTLAQDASPIAVPAATPNTDISGTIDVAMVANPQMVALAGAGRIRRVQQGLPQHRRSTSTVLPENEIRQTITQDVTTQSGQFDVFTIGPFEVPLWAAKAGWRRSARTAAADPAYDLADVFESMKAGLTYEDGLYALPFYGESAMTFYRKDLFEAAGSDDAGAPDLGRRSPSSPRRSTSRTRSTASACAVCPVGASRSPRWHRHQRLRRPLVRRELGRPARLRADSAAAIRFYIELLQNYGPPGVDQNGFTENETLFIQGKCAQWYDATSAAELITDPERATRISEQVGFAYAPTGRRQHRQLAVELELRHARGNSDAKEAALAFMQWATSKDYVELVVAADGGWGRAPTGARASIYDNPSYQEFAADFARSSQTAINEANPNEPTEEPVPYTGGQFVRIPEFQQLGNDVSREFASAMVGRPRSTTRSKRPTTSPTRSPSTAATRSRAGSPPRPRRRAPA